MRQVLPHGMWIDGDEAVASYTLKIALWKPVRSEADGLWYLWRHYPGHPAGTGQERLDHGFASEDEALKFAAPFNHELREVAARARDRLLNNF